MSSLKNYFAFAVISFCSLCNDLKAQTENGEPHRPQIHFTPQANWMNDPNGLVFYKGTYHLFYQYYPEGTVWGPMHWGHATSKDLVHWQHQKIALYPDSLGYIFSGSVVVDYKNTSGFGKNGKIPLVAIFTHHDPKGEMNGKNDFQNQSIAYSLDEGKTWTKYSFNPVLKNPGIRDFRDPKVSWNEAANKWIMTLATLNCITFYSSLDLKHWEKESEFGKEIGAHGGVWECPDLFPLTYQGKKLWVLLVNLNPGGPNGGSATQYFVGDFNGHQFQTFANDTRWIDYGPDEYAGITYYNTGNRKIFLGWMSNWQYATQVPTEKWRSATTIPRELSIAKVGDKYLLASKPVDELNKLISKDVTMHNIRASSFCLTQKTEKLKGAARLNITSARVKDFTITFSNKLNQKLVIGFEQNKNEFFIDRMQSGKLNFEKGFARKHSAPRFINASNMDITLIIDDASVELFADNGLTVMTAIFFPDENYSDIKIDSPGSLEIKKMNYSKFQSIYQNSKSTDKKNTR